MKALRILGLAFGVLLALVAIGLGMLYALFDGEKLKAEQLAPLNPRVTLVKAIAAYNTPAMFGGSMQQAKTLASSAIERFNQPCENICWGEAEAYTWRGLAKQELGDAQGAIEDWQQALQVEKDYGWAKFLLQQNQQISAK